MQTVQLKSREDKRIRAGHLWVYSNEIDVAATPIKTLDAGSLAELKTAEGKSLGLGYVNANSLIAFRLLTRNSKAKLDGRFFFERFRQALILREKLFPTPHYRLVHGEGDGLPGLVVDRFGEDFVLQMTTAGMERLLPEIEDGLMRLFPQTQRVFLRNDTASREIEGLPLYEKQLWGAQTGAPLTILENGARFEVACLGAQKTGWFYDHRMSRARLSCYGPDARVLDLFSYQGGWGVQAAMAGASEVICVDASAQALEGVMHNAKLNGVEDKVKVIQGDAFEVLRSLRDAQERFDLVVCDPPAFIKRKKDLSAGTQGYRRINELAIRALKPEGILVTASCSHHMSEDNLLSQVLQAARHLDREAVLLEKGYQGPDHPIQAAIAETAYLKTLFMRITPAWQ
jgi:23S rRNA (cytosine1962-C5)-methyltransferase